MSKGLSKMQRRIHGLLSGTESPVFYSSSNKLTTAEILDELIEYGMLDGSRPRKQLMATVLRACDSLCRRELVEGVYGRDVERGPAITVTWSAKAV